MSKAKWWVARSAMSANHSEVADQLLERIDRIPDTRKRLAARGLHRAATTFPGMASRYIGFEARQLPYGDIIGMGTDSMVFRLDSKVSKLHLNSLFLDRHAQDKFRQSKEDSHLAMLSHMSEFMISQSVDVDFLAGSQQTIVRTSQDYHPITEINLFTASAASNQAEALSNLTRLHPSSRSQLERFVESSINCFETTGYVPDFFGKGNLGLDKDDKLILIDGYPMPPHDQALNKQFISKLTSFGELVSS